MGTNGVTFDAKFKAYEQAMKRNENFGLSGDKLAQQYGRYTVGLQHDEIKAQNKIFGKEYGKALAQERADYTRFWERELPKYEAMRNARQAEQGAYFQGTSQEALKKLHNTGYNKELSNYYRALEAENNVELSLTGKVTPKDGKFVAEIGGKTRTFNSKKLADKFIEHELKKAAPTGNIALAAEKEGLSLTGKVTPKDGKFVAEIGGKTRTFNSKKLADKFIEHELKKAAPTGNIALVAENKGKKSGFIQIGKPVGEKPPVLKPITEGGATKIKDTAKAGSKLGKFFKGKGGKYALAGGLIAAAGLGLYALLKSDKKDKVNESENVNVTPTPEESTDNTPVVTAPVSDEVPTPDSEENQAPVIPVQLPLDDDGYYTTVKNDSFWNIAKRNLIDQNAGVEGYKPKDSEIAKEMHRIMAQNGYKLDENNWFSAPMLHPDVKLIIKQQLNQAA